MEIQEEIKKLISELNKANEHINMLKKIKNFDRTSNSINESNSELKITFNTNRVDCENTEEDKTSKKLRSRTTSNKFKRMKLIRNIKYINNTDMNKSEDINDNSSDENHQNIVRLNKIKLSEGIKQGIQSNIYNLSLQSDALQL